MNKKIKNSGDGYPDSHVEVVLKIIPLGPESSKKRSSFEKMIKNEMQIELIFAKKTYYFVS
jgi:hypothetical protein